MNPPPKSTVILATRGSKLALWQTDFVTSLLAEQGVTAEKNIIKTTGDKVQDRFLHEIGGKGLFVKELEQALESGEADLAVHSMKDLPAKVPAPFCVAAVLKRHSAADALIFRSDVAARLDLGPEKMSAETLKSLGPLKIGTASLRRQALLAKYAPEVITEGVRGNVDTRLRKLEEGAWDALILAEASLIRLGFDKQVAYRALDPEWFIPCAAQGALAIESREDSAVGKWVSVLGCDVTRGNVGVEREVLARLGGDCNMPFGCHVTVTADGGRRLRGGVYARGGDAAEVTAQVSRDEIQSLADRAVKGLAEAGAARVLRELGLEVPAELEA